MTATGTLPTLVFVHGALVRDGSWWWRPTADLLLERTGVASVAVALPSCGETDAVGGDLQDDAAALRAVLDAHDDVVLPAGRRRAPAARRVRPDDVAGRGGLRHDDDPDRVGRRRLHRRGVHRRPQHHGGAAAVARRPGDRLR
nr:hypothetical protein [Curtobacterium sp. ER1/6]